MSAPAGAGGVPTQSTCPSYGAGTPGGRCGWVAPEPVACSTYMLAIMTLPGLACSGCTALSAILHRA